MLTKIISFDAVVVGSGASGYNAACLLAEKGVKTAIVTENVNAGTSRNAGSDKQTYYKLSLAGEKADSVRDMAADLFSGGCVDGDNALCEAALSVRCFMRLVSLGVAFPKGKYGEYVGYKTDHDPRARASSAGPLTSKMMTEALQKEAKRLKIPVFSGYYAAEVLKKDGEVCGLLCVMKKGKTQTPVIFRTKNVVLATGGPAGIYSRSVYPESQHGSSGLALLAGASLQNMTEWQFGPASVNPRWNVSGTYMQALPKIVFRYPDGSEREILRKTEKEKYDYISLVFLKGYQWPFDSAKAENGSSQIDLIIEKEITERKCRVFLDYRENPFGIDELNYKKLSREAYGYLSSVDACFGKPVDRLKKMNLPAYEFYLSHGTDLEKDMLEISECVQHCNGGISVDSNWQTCVPGLFAAGECAGTHGIRRPGGSALNSGQVGSLRAAEYIAAKRAGNVDNDGDEDVFAEAVNGYNRFTSGASVSGNLKKLRKIMSADAGIKRSVSGLSEAVKFAQICAEEAKRGCGKTPVEKYAYRNDALTALAVAKAMLGYCSECGLSRGSSYVEGSSGREKSADKSENGVIRQVKYVNGQIITEKRKVRPIPPEEEAFEKVWAGFRENGNVTD